MTVPAAASPIDNILGRLSRVRQHGGYWMAQCPAHEDHNPSLAVKVGDDGRVLLNCHAGCDIDNITVALGIEPADLFPPRPATDIRRERDQYSYVDEHDELLYQVVRYEPKDFRQRRPDNKGGWHWNMQGARRVLYHLPQVLEAVRTGRRIYIVEGEKDADALQRHNEVATTNVGGAGKWRTEYTRQLTGAREIIIVADRDEPGLAHATTIANNLIGHAQHIRVVQSAEGKDAFDHLERGHKPDQFIAVPLDAELAANLDSLDHDDLETWARIDLRPALRGEIERPVATVLTRTDGQSLFYAGRVNGIHGDSGIGKSMVNAYAAAQQLADGHHVGWIDFEDPDETTIIERLRMFGATDEQIVTQFHYHRPQSPWTDDAISLIADAITEHHWVLCVIDSLGEAFGLEGINEDKDVEVGPWLRRVARRLADLGPAISLTDHSTKAADNPLHPSGSKRKRAVITGASYLIEAPVPLTRDRGGKLKITCAKDRHGNHQRGREVATLTLALDADGDITTDLAAPEGTYSGPTDCMSRIMELLHETGTEHSITQITDLLAARGRGFRQPTVKQACNVLYLDGHVHHRQQGQGHYYRAKTEDEIPLAHQPGQDTF